MFLKWLKNETNFEFRIKKKSSLESIRSLYDVNVLPVVPILPL